MTPDAATRRLALSALLCLLTLPACSTGVSATDGGGARFAVIGDYGMDGPAEAAVAALVKSWRPDFVITTGDNNYPLGEATTIEQNVGKHWGEFIGKGNNRFFPTLGNHDWGAPGARPYLDYFDLPNNERYYEVRHGFVHLFALDSDSHEPDGIAADSVQARWLEQALAASDACFQIVYFHHPPYSSGRDHPSADVMRWPFARWGAEAVLSGHNHVYERIEVDGLTYFVNGLGGKSAYDFGPPLRGTRARFNNSAGAMLVSADSAGVTFEFWAVTGERIDRWHLAGSCESRAAQTRRP